MTFTTSSNSSITSVSNSSTANVGGSANISAQATAGDTTITFADSSMFPAVGSIKIESEFMTYTANSGTVLSGVTRGAFNTTDATHANGSSAIGVYIGTSELNTRTEVLVSLKSDTIGTEYFDFSIDNTNWDTFPVSGFNISANIHEFHVAVKGSRYFRLRFENGSSSTTTAFRVHTEYGAFRQGNLPLDQSISDDSDATLVRCVNISRNPAGVYNNIVQNGPLFTTSTPLSIGTAYTTAINDLSGYSQISTELYADVAGVLVGEWYNDLAGTQLVRTFTRPYSGDEVGEIAYFSAPLFSTYLKYTYTNGGTGQTSFYLQTSALANAISGQILGLTSYIPTNVVANLGRNVIVGQTEGTEFKNVSVTGEGHLEVAVHGPNLPSGSIHVENMTPVFQTDFVYGVNPSEIATFLGINVPGTTSATVANSNNMLVASTGTTQYSLGTIQSKKRITYRPGQGVISKFTCAFSSPVASSYQVVGAGTSESGVYFGYNGTSFCILHSTGGIREIRTLTVSTASTATNNYNVTLNSTAYSITATSNSSTVKTAYEISKGTYTGWSVSQRGSTVVFLKNVVGSTSGTYSLAQAGAVTPAAGSFSQTKAGGSVTDVWIPRASWNADVMDGTGLSGNTLVEQYINAYKIRIEYNGAITFHIKTITVRNIPAYTLVHSILYLNTVSTVNIIQPCFPFTASAVSAGSTTNVSVSVGSISGFVEGTTPLRGPFYTYTKRTNNVISTSSYYSFFTIRNDWTFGFSAATNRANQIVVYFTGLSVANDDNTPISFYLIKNATLVGTPNFIQYSTSSCCYWDNAATTCTFSNNDQVIYSVQTGQTSGVNITFPVPFNLQPGETVTLAGQASSGTATFVDVALSSREEV